MSVSTSDCSHSIAGDGRRHHWFFETPQTQRHGQRGGGDHVSWETGSCYGGQQPEWGLWGWWLPPGQHLQTFGPKELPSAAQQTKDHPHPGLQRRWCSSQLTSTRPRCFWLQKQTACISEGKGAVILDDNHYPAKNPATGDDANIEGDTLRVVHEEKDFISLLCCTPGVFKDTDTCWSNSWLRRLDIFCYCLCLPPDAVGYRDPIRGSFLIQVVVDVFNGSAARDHLEELFRKVRFTGQSECRHCDERTLIFSFFCNAGHASLWRPSPGQQKADADQGQVHPHEALLLLPRPQPRLTP